MKLWVKPGFAGGKGSELEPPGRPRRPGWEGARAGRAGAGGRRGVLASDPGTRVPRSASWPEKDPFLSGFAARELSKMRLLPGFQVALVEETRGRKSRCTPAC